MAIISPARMASAQEAGWFFDENQQLRYQFRQAATPLTRPGGSALEQGDVWLEPNITGLTAWYWMPEINGGSWVGEIQNISLLAAVSNNTAVTAASPTTSLPVLGNLFIRSVKLVGTLDVNTTASYWTVQVRAESNLSGVTLNLVTTQNDLPGEINRTVLLDQYVSLSTREWTWFQRNIVGSPSATPLNTILSYAWVKA